MGGEGGAGVTDGNNDCDRFHQLKVFSRDVTKNRKKNHRTGQRQGIWTIGRRTCRSNCEKTHAAVGVFVSFPFLCCDITHTLGHFIYFFWILFLTPNSLLHAKCANQMSFMDFNSSKGKR